MTGPLTDKQGRLYNGGKGFFRPGDDRDILVTKFEIEKEDPVQLKEFYKALHSELVADGWHDPIDGKGDKFESLYWERILADGIKEHHVWWRCVKNPVQGNKYVRYALKVDIQTLLVKDTEIAYKGKKKKVQQADLIVRFWFFLQLDTNNKFRDSWAGSWARLFRNNYYKDEIEHHMGVLERDTEKIQDWIKTYLEMEVGDEQLIQFHPEMGYKDPYDPRT